MQKEVTWSENKQNSGRKQFRSYCPGKGQEEQTRSKRSVSLQKKQNNGRTFCSTTLLPERKEKLQEQAIRLEADYVKRNREVFGHAAPEKKGETT